MKHFVMEIQNLLLIPAFILGTACYGQESISVTDSSPSSSVPFDKSFKIVYTPSGKGKHKVSSVHLIELNKCGCMIPFECCGCNGDDVNCEKKQCKHELKQNKGREKKEKAKKSNGQESAEATSSSKGISSDVPESLLSEKAKEDLNAILDAKKINYKGKLDKDIIGSIEEAIVKPVEEKPKQDSPCRWDIQLFFTQPDSGAVNVNIPALMPNKRFLMVITWKGKPAGIDDVVDLLISTPGKAEEAYQRVAKNTEFIADNGVACSDCMPHFEIETFSEFETFARTNLRPIQYLIDLVKQDIKSRKVPTTTNITTTPNASLLSSILKFSQECLQCEDTLWEQSWTNESRLEFARTLVNLNLLMNPMVTSGQSSINEVNVTNPKIATEIEKRILNLQKTANWTSAALEFVQYYSIKRYGGATSYSPLAQYLEDAIKILWDNHKLLVDHKKEMDKLNGELKRLIAKSDKMLSEWVVFTQAYASTTTSTFTYNFDTRAGFYIKSDFGFMAYGEPNKLSGFSPFVGFHLNFRPMNTDVPYKDIRCLRLYERLSFHSGLLLGSFKKENERAGLIGNNAVFTGLGIAINHGVRITSGSVWYKQKDPSPFITNYKTAASFYVGVAIDLRLRDIYDSFKNVFAP